MSHTLLRRTFSRWIAVFVLFSLFTSLILLSTPHSQASPRFNHFNYVPVVNKAPTEIPYIFLREMAYRVSEAHGSLRIAVDLTTPALLPITVDYTVTSDSATNPQDYQVTNGTLSILPSQQSQFFEITIVQDSLIENNERFTISLSNAKNATLIQYQPSRVVIEDDDRVLMLQLPVVN